mgnify:CR=1 FL=1
MEIPNIHPICPMEEYAKRGRRKVWFIPPIPPIKEERALIIVINRPDEADRDINSLSGMIFCQVLNKRQEIHLNPLITLGNQK